MTKTISNPRYDFGTGAAIANVLNRMRQIVRENGDKLAYKDDKPCQRLCAGIIRQIEEEYR